MNFFKRMMGFSTDDLKTQLQKTSIYGTFYKIIKDARNIMYFSSYLRIHNAKISF